LLQDVRISRKERGTFGPRPEEVKNFVVKVVQRREAGAAGGVVAEALGLGGFPDVFLAEGAGGVCQAERPPAVSPVKQAADYSRQADRFQAVAVPGDGLPRKGQRGDPVLAAGNDLDQGNRLLDQFFLGGAESGDGGGERLGQNPAGVEVIVSLENFLVVDFVEEGGAKDR